MKANMVAFPAIEVFLALPEMTTAPSMPINTHTVVYTVALTCSIRFSP